MQINSLLFLSGSAELLIPLRLMKPSTSWTAAVRWWNVYLAGSNLTSNFCVTYQKYTLFQPYHMVLVRQCLQKPSPLLLCTSIRWQKDDTKSVSLIWITRSWETLWKADLNLRGRNLTCMFSVCLLCLNPVQSTYPFPKNVHMDPAQSGVFLRKRSVLAEILKGQKWRTPSNSTLMKSMPKVRQLLCIVVCIYRPSRREGCVWHWGLGFWPSDS